MTKRGKIKLNGPSPMFRVSMPGVDVDTAGPHQFIAHEDFIFSQPYAFGYVQCPFIGFTGDAQRDESVAVAVPNIGVTPIIHIFPVNQNNQIAFPAHFSEGAGSAGRNYQIINYFISGTASGGSLTIRFQKGLNTAFSPNGCYYILTRSANVAGTPGPGAAGPRMRINKNGIKIARPGYSVDTASEENLYFSSSGIAARVYETGLVGVSDFAGTGGDRYKRARVNFSKGFTRPPPVFAAGIRSDGGIDVTPVRYWVANNDYGRLHPHYQVSVDTSGFDLMVVKDFGSNFYLDVPTTWRYWVLDNVLDP